MADEKVTEQPVASEVSDDDVFLKVNAPGSSPLSQQLSWGIMRTGLARVAAATIGNGSATNISITHNLNTRDIVVQMRLNASPYTLIAPPEYEATDANNVLLKFSGYTPASNEFRVTILGYG